MDQAVRPGGGSVSGAPYLGSVSCPSGGSELRARWILCSQTAAGLGGVGSCLCPPTMYQPLTWLVCNQYCSLLPLRMRGSARR